MKPTKQPDNEPRGAGEHLPRHRAPRTQAVTIPIYGLSCGAPLVLEHVFGKTPGVIRAYVNAATELAYVEYDPALSSPDQLIAVVQHAGLRTGQPTRH